MADYSLALEAILKADSGVIGVVEQRIYYKRLPDDVAYPALVYSQIVGRPDPDHDGASTDFEIRYQLDCYGTEGLDDDLYKAARAALDNIPKGVYGGITVIGIWYIEDMPRFESDTKIDRRMFDIMMYVSE